MTLRLWSYVYGARTWAFLALGLLLVARLIDVVTPAWLGALVGQIVDGEHGADPGAILQSVWTGVGWVLALVVSAYILDSIQLLIVNYVGQRGVFAMRTQIYHHLQKVHIGYYDKQRIGQLLARTISDIEQVQKGLSGGLVAAIANVVILIGIFIGMFVVDWRVAVLVTLCMPVLYVLADWFRRQKRVIYADMRAGVGRLNAFVQEHLMGARILRRFGLQEQERNQFATQNHAFLDATLRNTFSDGLFFAGIDWMQSVMLIAVFVGLVEFGISGTEFRAGVFFTFSLYLLAFFRPVIDLTERYNALQEAIASSKRVFEVLDVAPAVRSEGTAPLDRIHEVSFDGVWFAYQEPDWVLQDVSLELKEGKTVALVGETGAGKTTLASLLLRFYNPQKGAIQVNGQVISDYSLASLRSHLAVVLQDPVIFSGTVRDNIALFDPTIPDDRLIEALIYAEGWEFVQQLPGGLDASLKEQGKGLSTGQRQLLSIARAVAQDRDVLILDEATANIDPLTEQLIQKALGKVLSDKTTLVVAHRLSTIRQADEIIVLEHGCIIERGTHEELLAAQGYYATLFTLQFAPESSEG